MAEAGGTAGSVPVWAKMEKDSTSKARLLIKRQVRGRMAKREWKCHLCG